MSRLSPEEYEEREKQELKLKPCAHCGCNANQPVLVHGEYWGRWDWRISCSSSHCHVEVRMCADGWHEQLDGERNRHIPPDRLYRDRRTDMRDIWNCRVRVNTEKPAEAGE